MPLPATPDFATSPLAALLAHADGDALPPVDSWHPPHCGTIDIRINADGRWFHNGGEITRPAMVRAFSRVLRREGDGSFSLVTPAEWLTIAVDDAPFAAIAMRVDGDGDDMRIVMQLTTGDSVAVGADHPLTLRNGPAGRLPYLHVRGPFERALEARPTRALYMELAELADADGMVTSDGQRYAVGDVG